MGFWGIEVKPGRAHPYHPDNVQGKLRVTQATLGLGSGRERTILQCTKGHKSPVFLCSLLPKKTESCSLDLEFDDDELVAFSVIGPQSIHLSGYFIPADDEDLHDEYELQSDSGEDVDESESGESEESGEFGTEDDYADDFMDDVDDDEDLNLFSPSSVPNSGVVIEEITDDEKPASGGEGSKKQEKNESQRQIVIRQSDGNKSVLESEDEDGFPITTSNASKATVGDPKANTDEDADKIKTIEIKKKKNKDDKDNANGKKRKKKSTEPEDQSERKEKKNKKQKEKGADKKTHEISTGNLVGDDIQADETNTEKEQVIPTRVDDSQRGIDTKAENLVSENGSEKKKKKKKKGKKKQEAEGDLSAKENISSTQNKSEPIPTEEKQKAAKSSKAREWPNGLVVEEIAMGKPDGKRASLGSRVGVHYIGKLQKKGKIFDSNIGKSPFKFRLGIGEVIKGWDVGVDGMRIGDKRRLAIPPLMGYGAKGAGKIPPNSWLVFEVELVNVG